MKFRAAVWVSVFVLTAGAISWGVLTDARETRLQQMLASIEAAERQIPYVGTRLMGGPETVKLRIWSRGGEKRVDFLGVTNAPKKTSRVSTPRLPFSGGVPAFLRPGRDQWKRKIKDPVLAVRNYDIAVTGRAVVAGRECEVIEVNARHGGRPSYRVLADAANRFPLRYEVLSKGQLVFETHFDEIQYDPAIPAGTFDTRKRKDWLSVSQEEVSADRMADAAGFTVLRPAYLPKGFDLRGSELIRVRAELSKELQGTVKPFLPFPLPKLDASVAHFTYTDGIAQVAIVQCSASSELWQHLKKWIPAATTVPTGDKVVARKFSDRGGSAYLLEVDGTVVLAAGNVDPDEIESMIRTLERR
jgi:negative regulator of sigma E activity